jgi:hypothetical protein
MLKVQNHVVTCIGSNAYGQLGVSPFANFSYDLQKHVAFPSGVLVAKLVAGNVHYCALSNLFQVGCWGYASGYVLGLLLNLI